MVAPTQAMLESLYRHYAPLPRGLVIPNGHDAALFHSERKQEYILSAGRLWDEGKNIMALGRVAARIPWPIYLAGEIEHPEGGNPVEPGLSYLGQLSTQHLSARMAAAAIFALPARYEPFGLSILEAALSGCALVLGDIPTLRELWDGVALFVRPDDTTALEQTLLHLINEPHLRQELGSHARARGLDFASEQFAERYYDLYRQGLIFPREQNVVDQKARHNELWKKAV